MAIEDKTVVLTIKSVTDGVDQSTAAIQKEGDVIAQTQTRIEARSLSLEKAATRYNELYRVEQTYTANQAALQRAMDTYIQKTGDTAKAQQLYGIALDGLNQKHSAALQSIVALGTAHGATTEAQKAAADAATILGVAQDGVAIKSNQMREAMVLVHEMLSGNYKRAVGSATIELQNFGLMQPIVTAAMSPLGLAVIAATAGTIAYTAANYMHHESVKAVADAYKLQGGAVGLSRSELESYAQTLGTAGDISVREARSIEAAALSAAQVPAEALKTIAGMAQDYAKAFDDGDLKKAATDLAQAFKDPIGQAQKLDDQLNILSDAQKQQIADLTAQGDKLGAFNVLMSSVKDRTQDLADHGVGYLGKSWHFLANEISNAWDAFGKWGSTPTISDQLTAATKKLNDLKDALAAVKANSANDPYGSQGDSVRLTNQIAAQQKVVDAAQQKADAEAAKAAADAEAAALRELGKQAGDVARSYDANATAAQKVKDDIILLTKAFMDGQLSADLYAKALAQAQTQLVNLQDPTTVEIAKLQNLAATANLIGLAQQNARAKFDINARTDITQPQKDALISATTKSNYAASAAANQNVIDTLDVQTEAQDRLTAAIGKGWQAQQEATNVNTIAAAIADGGVVKTKEYAESLAEATAAKQRYIDASTGDKLQQEAADAYLTAHAHQEGAAAVADLSVQLGHYQDVLAGVSPAQQAINDGLREWIALENERAAAGDYLANLKSETEIEQKTLDVLQQKKGLRTDEIEQLKLRLDIEKQFPLLSDSEKQKLIDQANQLAALKGQVQDQTKAWEDQQKMIADVSKQIERAMSQNFYDILTGKNTSLWANFKDMAFRAIADVAAKMVETQFVMPLVAGIFGTSSAASAYGGGLLGGGASGGGLLPDLSSLGGSAGLMGSMFGITGSDVKSFLGITATSGGMMGTLFGTAPEALTQLGGDAYIPSAAEELANMSAPTSGLFSSGGFESLGVGSLDGALAGIGGGMLGGSLLNGFAGGNSTNGTIGGGVGAIGGLLLGGPWGAAGGGILGSLLGGVFGPGKSVGPNSSAQVLFQNGAPVAGLTGADNGGDISVAQTMQQAAIAAFQSVAGSIAGLSGTPGIAVGTFGGKYFGTDKPGGGNAGNATYTNEGDAIANAVLMALKDSDLSKVDSNVRTAVGNIAVGSSAATINSDLTFATQFTAAINAMKAGATDFTQAAEAAAEATAGKLTSSIESFKTQTAALGLDTQAAADATKSAVESFLGITQSQPVSTLESSVETLYGKLEGVSGLLSEVGINQADAMASVKEQVEQLLGITKAAPAVGTFSAQIDSLKQTFTNLQPILDKLGISAQDASSALKTALDSVTTAVNSSLQSQIDQLTGGISSGLAALTTSLTTTFSDVQAANGDMAKAQQLAALEVANLYKPQVTAAIQAVTTAFNAQITTETNLAAASQKTAQDLQTFLTSMQVGSLSNLSPKDQLSAAKAAFDQAIQDSNSPDQTVAAAAQGQLTSLAQQYLTSSQAYNASGAGYSADYAYVQQQLSAAEDAAKNQSSLATQQVTLLQQQLSAATGTQTNTLSTTQALQQLTTLISQENASIASVIAAAGGGAWNGSVSPNSGFPTGVNVSAGGSINWKNPSEVGSAINAIGTDYTSLLGRQGTGSELAYYVNLAQQGTSLAQIQQYFMNSPEYLASHAHAFGGIASGLSLVGEEGPELINAPSSGARIYPASQTRSILGANNDNSAVVDAIKSLRADLRAIQAATVRSGKNVTEAVVIGNRSSQRLARSATLNSVNPLRRVS